MAVADLAKMYFFSNFIRSDECLKTCGVDEPSRVKVPLYVNNDPENDIGDDAIPVRHCGCLYVHKNRIPPPPPEPTCINLCYSIDRVRGGRYAKFCKNCIKDFHRGRGRWDGYRNDDSTEWKWVIEHFTYEELDGPFIPHDLYPHHMRNVLYGIMSNDFFFWEFYGDRKELCCDYCSRSFVEHVVCKCFEPTEKLEDSDSSIQDFVEDSEIRRAFSSPIPSFGIRRDDEGYYYLPYRPIATSSPMNEMVDFFYNQIEQPDDFETSREFQLFMHERGYH